MVKNFQPVLLSLRWVYPPVALARGFSAHHWSKQSYFRACRIFNQKLSGQSTLQLRERSNVGALIEGLTT